MMCMNLHLTIPYQADFIVLKTTTAFNNKASCVFILAAIFKQVWIHNSTRINRVIITNRIALTRSPEQFILRSHLRHCEL